MKRTFLRLTFSIVFAIIADVTIGQPWTCPLYAYYKMHGDANDSSGNDHHGTMIGTTVTTGNDEDPTNQALHFNGTSDRIDLPGDFDWPKRTINLWFKAESFPDAGGVIFCSDHADMQYGSTILSVRLINNENKFVFVVDGRIYTCTPNLQTNKWYMATIVYGPSDVRFYLNYYNFLTIYDFVQNPVQSPPTHSENGALTAKLGTTRIYDRFFQGTIDEVRIFQGALTDGEIKTLYYLNRLLNSNDLYLSQLTIFPNPAKDYINIEVPSVLMHKQYTVSIYDGLGQLKYKQTSDEIKPSINLSSFSEGIYLVTLSNDFETFSKSVLKIK
jgi:hypothetical protein